MKVRILTSVGIAVFGLPLLIFSDYAVYPIALGLLCALSAFELLRVIGLKKNLAVAIPTYILTALLPLLSYEPFFGIDGNTYVLILALAVFFYLLYLAGCAIFSRGRLGFSSLAAAFTAVAYVSVCFTSMSLLRYMKNGEYLFELIFIGAWVCDTFAYFTGRLFGRHKLAPELSPKKTVEGSVGGMLFTVGGFALYGFIIECVNKNLDANYLVLCILGLVISAVAQVGDLFASLIKREHGVKDYSKILPGHGGILDRFDSVLIVSPVLTAACILFPPFTVIA
ncbi:MAG: phosphatidate cytidylyltransferase [Clostridia bacterium]|nr:phosphatidate cytidylyltransferase [Clostridia bacterium]